MGSLFGVEIESIRLNVLLYPVGVWVVMAIIAVLNGGFREVILTSATPSPVRRGNSASRTT